MSYGTKSNIAFWSSMIAILAIVILFVVVFLNHNKNSRADFFEILKETEIFYTNVNSDNGGAVISDNDNRINARLNLLGERIVHYQKTSTDTLNWWIAILSILFVLVTGFNFYSHNEAKKDLDKAIKRATDLEGQYNKLINDASLEFNKRSNRQDSNSEYIKPVEDYLSSLHRLDDN